MSEISAFHKKRDSYDKIRSFLRPRVERSKIAPIVRMAKYQPPEARAA